MSLIHLAVIEPDEPQHRQLVVQQILNKLAIESFEIKTENSGKPYLQTDASRTLGISFSHARFKPRPIGVVAFSEATHVGVDIEHWRQGLGDVDFEESIAAPEDRETLRFLRATGHDPGVALWAIKEATLKCSGDVMIDPLHLATRRESSNVFSVRPSHLATAPLSIHNVKILSLINCNDKTNVFVVAVASSTHRQPFKIKGESISFDDLDWSLQPIEK